MTKSVSKSTTNRITSWDKLYYYQIIIKLLRWTYSHTFVFTKLSWERSTMQTLLTFLCPLNQCLNNPWFEVIIKL